MDSKMSMEGKVYTVTGAAGGIGLDVALQLAARGASLSLADVKSEELQKAQESIIGNFPGCKAITEVVDVRKRDQVEAWIAKTIKTFDKIDGCVNSAGVMGIMADIPNVSEEDLDLVIDINLKGTFNSLRSQLPNVVDGASIVNIASMGGLTAVPFLSPYCMSKHAVIGLTKTAAKENANRAVRVNAICPGMTETPMLKAFTEQIGSALTPEQVASRQLFKRAAKVDEVSNMVLFLLSGESRFITAVAYPVSGGWDV
ncbi:hypothetical protein N0V93_009941 [Gnomoniopsis smithogilvyi]|uniref:Uncharacterized protein n=1 Tax=Gnomoniopsis smithogilvyi TaxID=1191159 RepID=A0A9W8YHY8_9PEZI|nr:hypothetical protein N0V93_009941 [Gnomoniopsis smithogilvyi]